MTQKHPIYTMTVRAAGALTAERFTNVDGNVTAPGAAADGVAVTSANAAGELLPLDVIGTTIVTAGGAINAFDRIEVGPAGKAVTFAAGKCVGKALEAAANDGDRIEVLLIANPT